MSPLLRLDAELVRRGLARSREHAAELVSAGRVLVGGTPAAKPASRVGPDASVKVVADGAPDDYVSRGAHKLAGAFEAWPALASRVAGARCLDAGASTGGFTDVLLRGGASHVVAVDVGYGQLAWRLRQDSRVTVLERTNVRTLAPAAISPPVDLVVADLSFISLGLVLPALRRCARPDAHYALLVKPQFEVGRDRVGSGGVVREPALWADAIAGVLSAAAPVGLHPRGVVRSPLPGPAGNVEFVVWLTADSPAAPTAVAEWIAAAAGTGPAPPGTDQAPPPMTGR